MRDARTVWATAVVFTAALFGCSGVQRATLSPVVIPIATLDAPVSPDARKLVYRAPASRVHVHASDMLNGDHSITFSAFRGSAELDATGHGRFRLNVDMRTLKAESDFITGFAHDLLDVYTYPRATIAGRVEPVPDEPNEFTMTGNVELHGVQRGIQFRGTFTRTGENVHIHAVFKMSRKEFGIRATESDWIIQDDLRITLDLRAGPEKVTIEPLP